MPHASAHTSTKAGAPLAAPEGGFAMNATKEWEGCPACSGRTLLEVTDDTKTVVGYLESEYLWTLGIPEDPEEHPDTPHYRMQWVALDPEYRELPEIDTTQSLHFAASALLRRARPQAQTPTA